MTGYNIETLCKDLNYYLKKKYNYQTNPATCNKRTIDARRKFFKLYFRFRINNYRWEADTLVIANISFYKQRSGNGTDLLKFLVNLAAKYEITKIGIEETNSNSSAFARRFGFKNFNREDWIIGIPDLKIALELKN